MLNHPLKNRDNKNVSHLRSGTSQSCGLAAGAAGLVREYLSEWADLTSARLGEVWASSIKATLVAAADLDRSGIRLIQWLFLVPLKGGLYCLLGGYMLPTTFYGNQKQPLIDGSEIR